MKQFVHTWYNIDRELVETAPCENGVMTLELAGKKICIARRDDQYYAFAHTCPHAGAILANGRIDAKGILICPLHKYAFNIKNGYNVSGEGFFLKTYPVEQREDGIFIGL